MIPSVTGSSFPNVRLEMASALTRKCSESSYRPSCSEFAPRLVRVFKYFDVLPQKFFQNRSAHEDTVCEHRQNALAHCRLQLDY